MKNNPRESGEKRINILKRTVAEARIYRVHMKLMAVLLGLLVSMTSVLYISSVLYERSGSFTVSVDKYEMTKYGLSLSETKEMSRPTSQLSAKIAEKMTNIAGESIPDNVDKIDGEHNGRDYIAYTFYVQNAGEVEVAYDYEIRMSGVTNGLDEAIRVRLYLNGEEPTTYAKTKSDGSGPEPGTVEFVSETLMVKGREDGFEPEEKTKFTVVIWIEGNDPECLDWLIGGKMKLQMDFSVAH